MLNFDGVEDALAVLERARTEFEKLGYTVNTNKRLTLSEWNRPSVYDQAIEFDLSAKRLPLLDALRTQKTEDAEEGNGIMTDEQAKVLPPEMYKKYKEWKHLGKELHLL